MKQVKKVGKNIGARKALTNGEQTRTFEAFDGEFASRNRALFALLLSTGFRIGEAVDLTVRNCYGFGSVLDRINIVSKKTGRPRTGWLSPRARSYLKIWIKELGNEPNQYLFPSRQGDKCLTRNQAWNIFKKAFAKAEVGGNTGTHSCRKSYAVRLHKAGGGDLSKTRAALGHVNVNSTISYLESEDDFVRKASIETDGE